MAYNFKSETEVKDFIKNLGIEYRFGCYSEKKPEVCHLLADYLESIDKNYEKAARVYRNTCDDYKYARSCSKYATYALLGKGVKKSDFKSAYDYFEKGCNLNDPESCLHQGLLLITKNEQQGLTQDVLKGMRILEKSCSSSNANACYYLSGMYISGVRKASAPKAAKSDDSYEVNKNMKKAFDFASKGCDLGNMYSCANLSQMYARGDGVEKNPTLAAKYKQMAVDMQNDIKEGKTLSFQEGLT